MTIDKNKLVALNEYKGYYITHYGRICYFYKKLEKWMFCKKSEDLPNHVIVYQNDRQVRVNEVKMADKYVKNWRKEQKIYSNLTKISKPTHLSDGRYKEGRDTGRFGTDR